MDYNNAKVYKICCYCHPLVYIGSTCQPLSKRLVQHRSDYKCYQKGTRGYRSSFDVIGNCSQYQIELIEAVACNSKEEMLRLEGKYIKELDCVNKHIAGQTSDENYYKEHSKKYREDNPQYFKDYNERYYKNKFDIIQQKYKQTYECECGAVTTKGHKARHERSKYHQDRVTLEFIRTLFE